MYFQTPPNPSARNPKQGPRPSETHLLLPPTASSGYERPLAPEAPETGHARSVATALETIVLPHLTPRQTSPGLPPTTSPSLRNPALAPSAWAALHLGSLLQLDSLQNQILDHPSNRIALLCSRQWGKSTVLALKALHHALHHSQQDLLITSAAERQSILLLDKIGNFAAHLPITYSRSRHAITFPNGSRIRALPGSPDTIRGFSAINVLLIDEAAFAADELFHAALPFLATTNGHLWLASTPSGQSGFFYDLFAQSNPSFARFTATVENCPRIDPLFLAQERAAKPATQFAQEYLCQFLPTKGQLFDAALLKTTPQITHGTLAPVLLFGLDIGFHQSHTALAVLHLSWSSNGEDPATRTPQFTPHLVLRHLERFPLATAHSEAWSTIARTIQDHTDALSQPALSPSRILIFDYAGAGQVYYEHFRAHSKNLQLQPVTITGGQTPDTKSDYVTIPRQDLLNTLKVLLESGQLQIPQDLNHLKEFLDECKGLNLTNTHTTQDDLAVAVALAAYRARLQMTKSPSPTPKGRLF